MAGGRRLLLCHCFFDHECSYWSTLAAVRWSPEQEENAAAAIAEGARLFLLTLLPAHPQKTRCQHPVRPSCRPKHQPTGCPASPPLDANGVWHRYLAWTAAGSMCAWWISVGVRGKERPARAVPMLSVPDPSQAHSVNGVRWPRKCDYPLVRDHKAHHHNAPNANLLRRIVRDEIHLAGGGIELNRCLVDSAQRGYIAWREPQAYYGMEGELEEDYWWIQSVYVCEGERRKGVARALVVAVHALADGAPLRCEAARDAVPFWTSMGFTPFMGDELDGSRFTHMQLLPGRLTAGEHALSVDRASLCAAIGPPPPLAPRYPTAARGAPPVPPWALKPLVLMVECPAHVRNTVARPLVEHLNPVVLTQTSFIPTTDNAAWERVNAMKGVKGGAEAEGLVREYEELAIGHVTEELAQRCKDRGAVVILLDSGNNCLQAICHSGAAKLASCMAAHIEGVNIPPNAPPAQVGPGADALARAFAR